MQRGLVHGMRLLELRGPERRSRRERREAWSPLLHVPQSHGSDVELRQVAPMISRPISTLLREHRERTVGKGPQKPTSRGDERRVLPLDDGGFP